MDNFRSSFFFSVFPRETELRLLLLPQAAEAYVETCVSQAVQHMSCPTHMPTSQHRGTHVYARMCVRTPPTHTRFTVHWCPSGRMLSQSGHNVGHFPHDGPCYTGNLTLLKSCILRIHCDMDLKIGGLNVSYNFSRSNFYIAIL